MKRLRNYALTGLLAVLSLYGCKKSDTKTSTAQYSLQFRLADAAGPYDALNVDLEKTEIKTQSGNWYTLSTKAGVFDLCQLTNGRDTMLASATITEQKITQIRITMGVENGVVNGNQNFPLIAPIGAQNAIIIPVQLQLNTSQTQTYVLDMDAARSVTKLSNGKYQLTPKFRIFTTAATGAVSGTVSPANARPAVYAIMGTDTFGTLANEQGQFMVRGVPSGIGKLLLHSQGSLPDKIVDGISFSAAETTHMGTISMQ